MGRYAVKAVRARSRKSIIIKKYTKHAITRAHCTHRQNNTCIYSGIIVYTTNRYIHNILRIMLAAAVRTSPPPPPPTFARNKISLDPARGSAGRHITVVVSKYIHT